MSPYWPIRELQCMASHDNIKAEAGCCFRLYAAVGSVTLIEQDSLSMTYFWRWLLQAGTDSHPPNLMDDTAAQASLFYGCQSSGSVALKHSGSWPPDGSQAGRESAAGDGVSSSEGAETFEKVWKSGNNHGNRSELKSNFWSFIISETLVALCFCLFCFYGDWFERSLVNYSIKIMWPSCSSLHFHVVILYRIDWEIQSCRTLQHGLQNA